LNKHAVELAEAARAAVIEIETKDPGS